jgi:AAA15 family ATPase/GTPase
VDRSLHTLLTRELVASYLDDVAPSSRSQLVFTAHDVGLMDQSLLRRDEMWLAEKDGQGVSRLVPFSSFKGMRFDKDVRKSYLQGRLNGVPNFGAGLLAQAE